MRKNRTDELKGYKLDFVKNTLTLNYKFADAAFNDYGSPEYERMKAILADFPHLKVIVEAGRKITTTRETKRLTYDNMEKYMEQFDNSDDLLNMFYKVKRMSKPLVSPYKYVRDWFEAQFPDFRDCPDLEAENEEADIVDAPDTNNYKVKEDV